MSYWVHLSSKQTEKDSQLYSVCDHRLKGLTFDVTVAYVGSMSIVSAIRNVYNLCFSPKTRLTSLAVQNGPLQKILTKLIRQTECVAGMCHSKWPLKH